VREFMSNKLGFDEKELISDVQLMQARLPLSKGGLGMLPIADRAPAAYIASLALASDFV
jgi:hypothetical protein